MFFRLGATGMNSGPLCSLRLEITPDECVAYSIESWKGIRRVSPFNLQATQVLTRTDGGRRAAVSGQKL